MENSTSCGPETVTEQQSITLLDLPKAAEFQLNCTFDGKMEFKGFQIRNLTWNSLSLNLSADCNRPITQVQRLFGRNYALTAQNGLLLQNCSTPSNGLVGGLPARVIVINMLSVIPSELPVTAAGVIRVFPVMVSNEDAIRPVHDGGIKYPILIGGIAAGAAFMAILAGICYCCQHHSMYLKNRTSAKRLLSEAGGSSPVPMYPYKEIERATDGFSEKQRLNIEIADGIEQVMNEIKLLSSVSHPNLVRLLGCCIENGEQILVYEYMPNGTLSQHLQRERERGKPLPWTVRLTIASETAQAISYLHTAMNPPIYHRDIKTSNILLDFDYRSKVADFGLSRLGMEELSHISTAPQGTPGYVDPQYHQNFHLSDKSDVYSFGVVLVEIITAMKVVDFNRSHSEVNLAALAIDRIGKGRIDEMVDPYIELHRDAWTLASVHKVAELAFRCLAYHRDMRPSMMEVAHELEQIRQSGWASLDENVCMGSSVASSCSSPCNGSARSFSGLSMKKSVGSQRLIVSQKPLDHLASLEEGKDSSPVSVHDPWFSEQSSPSTNSLLGNVIQ
ncbi:Wall-associated receptor kinase-like 14 [Bienertia sinuspersici]